MHRITQKKYQHMKRPPATQIEHDTETKGCCDPNPGKCGLAPHPIIHQGGQIVKNSDEFLRMGLPGVLGGGVWGSWGRRRYGWWVGKNTNSMVQ